MKINDMITKFRLELTEQNGEPAVKCYGKPTKKQLVELKAAKPEIITELQRRAQERAEWVAKERAEEAAEREAIISGEKHIQLRYHDGEYLSGWSPVGQSSDIMQKLGLAEYVSGWGLHVEPKTIKELGGPEFTYQQALELSQTREHAKEQAKKAAQEKQDAALQAAINKARETGKPVLLKSWMEDCSDPREECSLDLVTIHALPDGTTRTERQHTW